MKIKKLQKILKQMKSVLLAYSGGVDSTFLLKVALDTLEQDNVIAVTAASQTYPKRELREARSFAKLLGARHIVIDTDELNIKNFRQNPRNRCYYCKEELFGRLKKIAKNLRIKYVIDASNVDDKKDYRPGSKAKEKLGVRSPLQEAGMGKKDIRRFSKKLGLSTWNKPSFACLASRFPYNEEITEEKLERVEKAEDFLRELGFKQFRVRTSANTARIEVLPDEINKLIKKQIRDKIISRLKKLGYTYVSLDLEGYRTGSMNEILKSI